MTTIIEYLKRPFERSFWRNCLSISLLYIDQNYFYRSHFLYIVLVGFLGSCAINIAERDQSFLDCLYHSYSAITSTGLASIDLSRVSVFTQVTTFILMQLGSSVMLTLPVVLIKRHYLRRRFKRKMEKSGRVTGRTRGGKKINNITNDNTTTNNNIAPGEESIPATRYNSTIVDDDLHVGMVIHDNDHDTNSNEIDENGNIVIHHFDLKDHHRHEHQDDEYDEYEDYESDNEDNENEHDQSIHMEGTEPNQNATNDSTIEETGMVHSIESNLEYRSLGKLLYIIPLYQLSIYTIGIFVLSIQSSTSSMKEIMHKNQVNGLWWSIFESVSAFNNCGFVLFTDNLVQLNNRPLILVTISFLIAVGNTLYPVFLRLIIAILKKVSKDPIPYEHLSDNPRSLYTHLFPFRQTMILMGVWFAFTVSQMSLMAILESNDKAFEGMSSLDTFFNYYFQSVSTRTAGFNSIDVSLLSSSVLILFLGLMFVSSYPFVISLKGSAVNGKYSQEELKTKSVMKDILIRDIFIIYICILLIGIVEEHNLDDTNNSSFTVFHVIFEVISAFGCVGLSMGFPGAVSFSAVLRSPSKLVIIVVMLLGKHRALPDSIDTAVVIKEKAVISKLLNRRNRQQTRVTRRKF